MKKSILINIFLFLLIVIQVKAREPSYNEVKERFDIMNANSELTIEFNDKIYNQINRYSKEGAMSKVAGSFLFYSELFDRKFSKFGIPTELKYLAVIESRMNARTISSAGAMGVWQIMPETGDELTMRKDKYINDWFNPVASSDASARYLKNAYKSLGDWNLTLVSYNCGIGNVKKGISKSGSKNIWKVYPFLPKETRDYIIRFYAMKYLLTWGDYHNFYPMMLKYNYNDVEVIFHDGKSKIIKDNWYYFLNPHILTDYVPTNAPYMRIKRK